DGSLGQNALSRVIHLRRDKINCAVRDDVSGTVEERDGLSHTQLAGVLYRNIDVGVEIAGLVNRREQGGSSDAIADMNRNVANNSIGGRCDAGIVKLNLLLTHLCVQGLLLRKRIFVGGPESVQILFGDDAGVEKLLSPLILG